MCFAKYLNHKEEKKVLKISLADGIFPKMVTRVSPIPPALLDLSIPPSKARV